MKGSICNNLSTSDWCALFGQAGVILHPSLVRTWRVLHAIRRHNSFNFDTSSYIVINITDENTCIFIFMFFILFQLYVTVIVGSYETIMCDSG